MNFRKWIIPWATVLLLTAAGGLAAYTNTWDETAPAGSALASTIDDHIRQVKLDARERLAASSANWNQGLLTLAATVQTTGSPVLLTITGPAHTTLTASTEATDVNINLARTVQFATGALTTQRAVRFQAPTYGFVAASTLTTAATVSISGPPVAGTNATLTNSFSLWVESGATRLDGILFINDTANANMTVGLTISQGANDNEILALKSSDVAHGMTTVAETDTYATFSKVSATDGGLHIRGLLDGSDQAVAIYMVGTAVTANTAKTAGAAATIRLDSRLKSGTGETGTGANANLVIISDNSTGRFIFDAEGSAHADVEWVAFQGRDDVKLLADLEAEFDHRKNGRPEDAQSQARTAQLRAEKLVNFMPGRSRAMVDTTRLAMLKVGAIRQLAARVDALERRQAKPN